MAVVEKKLCSKCGTKKSTNEFSKNKSCKDGLRNICRSCDSLRYKVYRQANKKTIAERNRKYYQANKEARREYDRLYRQSNKESLREKRRIKKRNRRKNDSQYRLKKNVSESVRKAIRSHGATKGGATFSALPYSPQDLVEHLEKQFDQHMTWDNYGTYWHIDHIYPHSLLPYDSLSHQNNQKCWALENLQPLEATENRKKSNKIILDNGRSPG